MTMVDTGANNPVGGKERGNNPVDEEENNCVNGKELEDNPVDSQGNNPVDGKEESDTDEEVAAVMDSATPQDASPVSEMEHPEKWNGRTHAQPQGADNHPPGGCDSLHANGLSDVVSGISEVFSTEDKAATIGSHLDTPDGAEHPPNTVTGDGEDTPDKSGRTSLFFRCLKPKTDDGEDNDEWATPMLPEDGSTKTPGFHSSDKPSRRSSAEDEWSTPTDRLPENRVPGMTVYPSGEDCRATSTEDEWTTPPASKNELRFHVAAAAAAASVKPLEAKPSDISVAENQTNSPRYVKNGEFQTKRGYQILEKYTPQDVETVDRNPDHVYKPVPFVEDADDSYNMEHPRRGVFILLNNKNFAAKGVQERTGTDVDADNLTLAFSRLGFRVQRHDDLSRKDMLRVFKQVASEDHSDADCFGCAILSHGDEGIVFAKDTTVEIDTLLEPVKMCPSLRGKPKVFFIQACRGCKLDDGFDAPDGVGEQEQRIPQQADCLYAYSTTPGYFSWRNKGKGSWFVQALCTTMELHGNRRELMWLLTTVNRRVAYDFQSRGSEPAMDMKKQIPCIRSQLTKQVFFKPKHSAQPGSSGGTSRLMVVPPINTRARSAPNSRSCSPGPPTMNVAYTVSPSVAPPKHEQVHEKILRSKLQIAPASSRIQPEHEAYRPTTSRGEERIGQAPIAGGLHQENLTSQIQVAIGSTHV